MTIFWSDWRASASVAVRAGADGKLVVHAARQFVVEDEDNRVGVGAKNGGAVQRANDRADRVAEDDAEGFVALADLVVKDGDVDRVDAFAGDELVGARPVGCHHDLITGEVQHTGHRRKIENIRGRSGDGRVIDRDGVDRAAHALHHHADQPGVFVHQIGLDGKLQRALVIDNDQGGRVAGRQRGARRRSAQPEIHRLVTLKQDVVEDQDRHNEIGLAGGKVQQKVGANVVEAVGGGAVGGRKTHEDRVGEDAETVDGDVGVGPVFIGPEDGRGELEGDVVVENVQRGHVLAAQRHATGRVGQDQAHRFGRFDEQIVGDGDGEP